LTSPVTPAGRQDSGLQIDPVDAEAVLFLEWRPLNRVDIESSHHAMQTRHVAVVDQVLPAVQIPQVRLPAGDFSQPSQIAQHLQV
jgi:hypothetical protein